MPPAMCSATRSAIVSILACLCLAACGDGPTSITPAADLVQGYWIKDQTMDGSAESWQLSVSGDTVTGKGGWKGDLESGQLAVSGTIVGDSLHLHIRYFSGQAALDSVPRFWTRFDGTLISRTELSGTQRTPVTPPAKVRLYKSYLVWVPGADRG